MLITINFTEIIMLKAFITSLLVLVVYSFFIVAVGETLVGARQIQACPTCDFGKDNADRARRNKQELEEAQQLEKKLAEIRAR